MNTAQQDFYYAVLAIGALIAQADGNPDSRELAQLKKYFQINVDLLPRAASVYNGELHDPRSIRSIIKPFEATFKNAPELCESFLFGLCLVALADGELHTGELALLNEFSTVVGLNKTQTDRVFISAGVFKEPADDLFRNKNETTRQKHLRVLGLLSDATTTEIDDEFRRLSKRYHPDRLRAQNLPEAEIRHAEALLRQIIESREWLKKNN
ncbi:MAG: TerB family tellurite resistance protein [Sedimentitalea sp.]|nr:TerB family tellurite resistance protein [Sedimentitalea sp.]